MFPEKERDHSKILIVVLDGPKVLREKSSVVPLSYALRQVVQTNDQVVVLIIFNSGDLTNSPVISCCCIGTDGRNHQRNERVRRFRILREEIIQEKEGYTRIFRPFYKECKNKGVKFIAKLVVGPISSIINEEKIQTGATLVVTGRSFMLDNVPCLSRNSCNSSSINGNEEVILYTSNPPGEKASD